MQTDEHGARQCGSCALPPVDNTSGETPWWAQGNATVAPPPGPGAPAPPAPAPPAQPPPPGAPVPAAPSTSTPLPTRPHVPPTPPVPPPSSPVPSPQLDHDDEITPPRGIPTVDAAFEIPGVEAPAEQARLPLSGFSLNDSFVAWADEHDRILCEGSLQLSRLQADEKAVKECAQSMKSQIRDAISAAPSRISNAFGRQRHESGPIEPGKHDTRGFKPGSGYGSSQRELDAVRRELSRLTSAYSYVAQKNAIFRAGAIREKLIPPWRQAERRAAGMSELLGPLSELRRSTTVNYRKRLIDNAERHANTAQRVLDDHRALVAGASPTGVAFDDQRWQNWQPPESVREILVMWQSVPFGLLSSVAHSGAAQALPDLVEGGVTTDFRQLPGFTWFVDGSESDAQACYESGVDAARALILRLMAAIPPGKARFTFVDPLGSGNNVAPFLELGEWDPLLIDTKAWCRRDEIAEKLTELNSHLELVIQKYLKGRFESIEDYNTEAGEVAEPYRFLVIFDFPAQFDEQTSHLLARLVQNGQRCGVYVIVVRDGRADVPYGVDIDATLKGLIPLPTQPRHATETAATTEFLEMGIPPAQADKAEAPGGPKTSSTSAFRDDVPPPLVFDREAEHPNLFTRVMLGVGEGGQGANEVAVGQQRVDELVASALSAGARVDLPDSPAAVRLSEPSSWWQASAATHLSAAIGRAGAKDPAFFKVDTKILSGGLIVGRPGSGKSTLLHALIANLAAWYSPDEIELFLLDFKQGVEFLGYAEDALPHARCVAIESEREFGFAILDSLRTELERRADVFKQTGSGVTDLPAYRSASNERMPRILVLIDEFQELLNRNDRVSTDTAQTMDLLIRQGRAFGIHLVLGSQSLSSIDAAGTGIMSTLRLLPIRIVLPSDASDAAIALGDDNDEARYLTRQGEGIYNAAGGNADHNVRFQGTFITDEQRRAVIREMRAMADRSGFDRRPVVFNGQAAAEITESPSSYVERMSSFPGRGVPLPIGAPMTLESDLTLTLPREPGGNALMLCRDAEIAGAWGALTGSAATARCAVNGGLLEIIDCSPAEMNSAAWIDALTSTGVVRVRSRRQLEDALKELKAIVQDRLESDEATAPSHVVMLWALHRARVLEPGGGFGYSDDEDDASSHLEWLLQNGPEVGVHVIGWVDTAGSLGRRLTNTAIREFGFRLSTQLNDTESDALEMQATSLKPNQLACANVDEDRHWKVRAYGRPRPEWLAAVAAAI